MGVHRSFKATMLGCVYSIGIVAGGVQFAVAQTPDVATLSPTALRNVCIKDVDYDPARTVIACGEFLRSAGLDDRVIATAHLRRAQAYVDLDKKELATADYDTALRLLDKLIDPEVALPADLFQRALALQGLGNIERAMVDYGQVIQRDPHEIRAFVNRGRVLSSLGRYGEAIADFDSAIRLSPDNTLAFMERGNAYGKTGEYARSLADLNKAIALSPANADAYVMRGVAYGHQGKNLRAGADYDKALSIDPRNADALTDRAAIRQMNGENRKAIEDLTTSMALLDNDNDALAHYNRGVAYFALGLFDKALADYTAAVDLDGKMEAAFANLCLTRIVMGRDPVAAMADCDKAIALNSNAVNLYNIRGFVDLKLGRTDQALADYNTALKLDPNSPHALYGRGLAKVRSGDMSGEADRAAARAARPDIERSFSVFGVI